MEIREYKNEDFEGLANLTFELSKLEKDWIKLKPEMVTLENVKMWLTEETQDEKTKYFVCDIDGKIAGFISGEIKKHDIWYQIDQFLYIDDLFVNPNFRRKGIASALLKKMEEYAKENNVKEISFNVSKKNKDAMKLYESTGYKIEEYKLGKVLD